MTPRITLRDWLEQNPFTLSLSSAFFGFFAHAGAMQAFEEAGLKPKALSGASAGAIVAAGISSGISAKELQKICLSLKLADFWDPGVGLGFVKGHKIDKLFREIFVADFSQASIPLRISTFDILSRKTKVFTSGDLILPVRASIAVPLLFRPVKIGSKFYWDGGTLDKMAVHDIPSTENVLCTYLASDRWVDSFEIGRRPQSKNLKVMTLRDLPRSGPHLLHRGSEAIEVGYKLTLQALNSAI